MICLQRRQGRWLRDGTILPSACACVVVDRAIQFIQSGSGDAASGHQETAFGGKCPHLFGCVKGMPGEYVLGQTV
jgi:hypothetical protein